MWHLVQSNRLESLCARLAALMDCPPADPLAPEIVVVSNTGMARWLSQQLALATGIAANIDFPLPARAVWQILASQVSLPPAQDDFTRPVLCWRLFETLNEGSLRTRFPELAAYLGDDRDGGKRLQFAQQLADLFDQYLVYRPDLLLSWEGGEDRGWQAHLWRKLASGRGPHRAGLLQRFRDRARAGALSADGLPPRLVFFGISNLPPSSLEVLAAISGIIDVHLFHLNPCRHYWADLTSPAELARRRARWRESRSGDLSTYFEVGNPLLASLGKAGRDFANLLAGLEGNGEEHYEDPEAEGMLGILQRDILELEDRSRPEAQPLTVAAEDRSVQAHACHSRLREVQVLHDSLLEMFARDPELTPREILVMAPEIEAYGPALQAVFDSARDERFIPWSLADRALHVEQPLAEAFLALFDLPGGRCTAPAVLAFLELEPVRRRFALEEEGLATIRRWLHQAGIRWGLDQAQRRELGLDMDDRHSWAFGLRRLFLGYCSGEDAPIFRNIAPCGPIAGGDAVLLGTLAEFIDRLHRAGRMLAADKPPAQWGEALLALLVDFFDPGEGEEGQEALQAVRAAVGTLVDACAAAGFTGPISPPVVRAWLRRELAQPAGGHAFLSGRVTFCNMVPMRSIPFAVICLLGMNDPDYPRHQQRVSFDQLAADPRLGDRNRRDDDRYLFLESLLSARRVLYLSWIGRDQRDNRPRPPSVVVAEVLDYLARACRDEAGQPPSLVREHPLQPFSPGCFDGSSGPASYAQEWFPGGREEEERAFVPGPLPETDPAVAVDLGDLQRFWKHPVRFFLQERLGLELREEEADLAENEPFAADHLARYSLSGSVLQARLAGEDEERTRARIQAAGELPHGGFGENTWSELHGRAEALQAVLTPLLRDPLVPQEVNIALDGVRLSGWLDSLHAAGCVRYRPAKVKGRDLVSLWLAHLVLNIVAPAGCERRSYQVAVDGTVCLGPVEEPAAELRRLLAWYRAGQREPLHFFPETALAWGAAKPDRRTREAEKAWQGGFQLRGEGEDPFYRLALRGREPLNQQFRELAAGVFLPLLAAREG